MEIKEQLNDEIIGQRDRFLALAFTSADVLIEIDPRERVTFSCGALNEMLGLEHNQLKGANFSGLFAEPGRSAPILEMIKKAVPGLRCGPVMIALKKERAASPSKVLLSAIKIPNKNSLYIALAFPRAVTSPAGPDQSVAGIENVLLDKEQFLKSAQKALYVADNKTAPAIDMTLLDLPDLPDMKKRMPETEWGQTMDLMAGLLKLSSFDGHSATRLTDSRYGVLHVKSVTPQSIQEQISGFLKETDPGKVGVEVRTNLVDVSAESLSEKEASRALVYTLMEFEKKGSELTIKNLDDGFKDCLAENANKMRRFKTMVSSLDFHMHFQPIVSLQDLKVCHYEMLARFRDGTPTYDWITFGEEIGLVSDFDMAVCTRAVRYVQRLPHDAKKKFAVNISGRSVENDRFIDELYKLTRGDKLLPEMIMFEITESANIRDLDQVNNFISTLQKDGYSVCLDDFGAGSASFQYLHRLHVDYIKLDGSYVQHLLDNKRDQAMVRSLVQLCKQLKVKMVAEHIETLEEAMLLNSMGVDLGQGYWFSKPNAMPDYIVDTAKLRCLQLTEA